MAWPCMALPPDSCDHRQIEYALQLAIGKHAEVRRISAIDNPLARHQFGRRTSGVLKLHSFVAEDDGAAVEDGRLRWAAPREGTSGMSVHIGAVPPGVLAAPTDADSGRRTLVYCLAAVGQAWPVDAATLARCQTERGIQPPTGYDSFVLGETIAAPEDGSGADGGSWRHRWIERRSDDPAAATAAATAAAASRPASYWLADRSQVLPMYVVEFDVQPPPAAAAAAPSATVACDDPGHCQYHNCPCEYYCPRCQTAMCAECKLTGHHSHGPALRHVLQPLPVAYRAAVENCQDGANPMLLTAVANLDAARESVRARAAAVQDNAADVRRGLAAMVSAINAQIDHAENCRLAALQSQEIELARQLRTLRAGEDFLRSQTDNLPMAAFMQTWATHVHSRTPMLSEGAPDLLLAGGVGGGSGEATGVMGYEAHSHGTPVHGPDTSAGALSMSSGGSSLVSFDSPSQMSLQGSNSVAATPHGATPGAGLAVPGSCSSAVAEALMDVSPLPNLTLHGAIGLRVANGVQQEHQQAGQTHPPSNEAAEPWWEPPKTVSAATRAASAARSASTVTANRQFLVAGGESAHGGVQWGWCSQPDDGQSRAKERAARLRSAFRNAAMAGGGAAAALMGGEGGGRAKSATLSRSAEVIVAQAVTLASGKVNALQSIEVTPCSCESGNNRSEPAVRVEIRHADAASGGLGIGFGRYNLPYRFPAACTTNACAVQISSVVPGSVASLRPDLRVGSVIVAVNGHRVNTMRLEDVMKELEAAEAAAALEMDGELDEASLVLELLHEHSAPAMPPLSPRERGWNEDGAEEQLVEAAQPAPPRPPPPFADRVADQLDDVLSEVILEEQTAAAVRIQAVYRGGVQRLDNQISHLAATMVQAAMRGARARKAIAVHRAALLAEEERTRQAELAAMPPLQEAVEEQEVEEEPVDMSFKQQHVRETPPSGRAATSVSAAKHDGSQPWDDAEVPVGLLGAKLRTLESAAAANAEDSDGSMIATPRTLARQLEEDERELGRVEARIEELSSAKKPPAQSVSAAVEAEEEAATEEEEDEQDEQEGQEGQEKESTTAAAVVAEVAPASPSVSQQPQRALEQTRTPLEVPDLLARDQAGASPAPTASPSPSPSPSRAAQRSPRVLGALSTNAEANAANATTPGASGSKGHWGSVRDHVKKPPGQSLLERMQAVAKQAAEAKGTSGDASSTSRATPSSSQGDAKGEVALGDGAGAQDAPAATPVRPPRPSGQGSKSRLAENRARLLQAE